MERVPKRLKIGFGECQNNDCKTAKEVDVSIFPWLWYLNLPKTDGREDSVDVSQRYFDRARNLKYCTDWWKILDLVSCRTPVARLKGGREHGYFSKEINYSSTLAS